MPSGNTRLKPMSDPNAMNGFRHLFVADWRQFGKVDIKFHETLTVLTGANASGKTTLLSILASLFNWTRHFLSQPQLVEGKLKWNLPLIQSHPFIQASTSAIGSIQYVSGARSNLLIPASDNTIQYSVNIEPVIPQAGLYITSHRSVWPYSGVPSIPTRFPQALDIFEQYTNEVRTRHAGGSTGRTPLLNLKEALVAAAMFGEGNSSVEPNPEALNIWEGFQQILVRLMPRSLGFKRLTIRMPEVVMITDSGDFAIDDASGGMSALIELGWQIFLQSRAHETFVVLIDEPENHLHPSLQRSVIPDLVSAFPRVQFIVSTHSPFVVTSVPDSAVFVLDYEATDGVALPKVFSRELDFINKAATAEETLRRVLGVETSLPIWAEQRFDAIVREQIEKGISKESLTELREKLTEVGLADSFPRALVAMDDSVPEG